MLGAGLLAWRLEHGTIDLGFLVPLVERAGPAASLSRIEVRDGEVVATDPRSGASWRAAAVQMVVERRHEALAMTLAARLELEKSVVPLHAAVLLPADEGGSVTLRFD